MMHAVRIRLAGSVVGRGVGGPGRLGRMRSVVAARMDVLGTGLP